MRALSLFTGIMGIDLACEWAGIETVAMCEKDPFCQKVIRKHKPNMPLYEDVCTLTKERLEQDGIIGNGGAINLIHGGYPCQPFSLAGKRQGERDDRHLWPEVKRLLEEIRPRWFVGENVAGHITMGLDDVLSDLESIGYTREAIVFPACSIGAPHERERVFILAYTHSVRDQATKKCGVDRIWTKEMQKRFDTQLGLTDNIENVWDTHSKPKLQTHPEDVTFGKERNTRESIAGERWGSVPGNYWGVHQPPVCGVDDGIPRGLDKGRLIALGNAVVPQQIYPLLAAIKQIDNMVRK